MKRLLMPTLCVLACALIAAAQTAPPQTRTSALEEKLNQMATAHHGKVALFAKDLTSGETVAIDPDVVVQTASTIKLELFIEAFHRIKDGKLSLGQRIKFLPEDKVEGSGVLQFLRAPDELPLEDALVLMMIESDNTATNLVIDAVGLKNANERGRALGLKDTYFYKKVFKKPEGPMPADQKIYGLGKTTAREMATMAESIAHCELASPELCAKMVAIMKAQQYRNMIPHYIEAETDTSESGSIVADKLGALDAVRADVGIVYGRRGPMVISIFTYDNKDQSWTMENEGELLVAKMAKEIFNTWGK